MRTAAMPAIHAIDYGERARLGIIVPSGNVIAEPQIHAMLPAGVAAYITRLPLQGSGEAELLAMPAHVESAARLLAHARVDAVVFHCTAVSTYSRALSDTITRQIAQTSGLPSFATSDAIIRALEVLRARKIVLLTPYIEAVTAREVSFLADHGVQVLQRDSLGIDTNTEMARLAPQVFVDMALRNRCDDADAYFLSCTAIRSAEIIDMLENRLQRPVLTSNQAMVWHALRACGIGDAIPGFGALMARPA
jgi:maleate cis-trans isomerase